LYSLWNYLCQILIEFCDCSGVSGEGSGVTVESSLVAEETVATPPVSDTKAVEAEDEDDDDVDLFGEETEEEKKAAEERAAAVKASGKKKESKFLLYLLSS